MTPPPGRKRARDAPGIGRWHHARTQGTIAGRVEGGCEVRELHCACGNRLVAESDEDLVQQVLDHAHEVHTEMNLDEGQAREMVASQASDTEDASH